MRPSTDTGHQRDLAPRLAWLPVPLFLVAVVGLWSAGLQTSYESRTALLLLNLLFTAGASLCIGVQTGRSFLASGQPGLLLFGCGALVWGSATMAASALVDDRGNVAVTVHNLGVFLAALCHLGGLLDLRRRPRPGRWLAAGYAGVLVAVAVLVVAADRGWTPVFFVQGQGGTLVRQFVLGSALGMFAVAAGLMLNLHRRQASAFWYWYGLGLALLAIGLLGVLVQLVNGGVLGWTGRSAQYLGGVYLLIAARVAGRNTGAWKTSLAAVEDAWRTAWLPALERRPGLRWAVRYGLAVAAVAVAFGVRQGLAACVGPGLPPYLTFFPAVVVVGLLGGLGPGVVATLLSLVLAAYSILPPVGQFAVASPADRLGLVIALGVGVFVSVVAELYRRYREKAAVCDRELAVRDSRLRLAALAEATFEGIVESEAGRIRDCNEQFAALVGCAAAELQGEEFVRWIAPEDRARVSAGIEQGQESAFEYTLLRRDGSRLTVEAHCRVLAPERARRHIAVRDVTERKRAEDLVRVQDELLLAVVQTQDLPQTLRLCLAAALKVSGMDCGALYLADTDGGVRMAASAGLSDDFVAAIRYYPADDVHTRLVMAGEPVYSRFADIGLPLSETERRHGVRALAVIPIRHQKRVIGCLNVGSHALDDVPRHSRAALQSIASTVGLLVGRAQAEEALRASEELFRVLFTESGVGQGLADPTTHRIVQVNEALCRMLGYSPAELLQRTFLDLHHPDDRAQAIAAYEAMLRGDIPGYHQEKCYRRADGNAIWVNVITSLLRDAAGRPFRSFAVIQDITERKQAEEAVRRSEALLRAVLDNSPDAIFLKDRESRLLLANPATFAVIGKPPAACLGKTDAEFYDDAAAGRAIMENDRRIMNSGRTETLEETVHGPAGRRVYLSTKAPYRDADGGIAGVIGVACDITAHKLAEEAIQRHVEEVQQANQELAEFNRAAVDRELRMIELKREINALCAAAGQPPRYDLDFAAEPPPPSAADHAEIRNPI